MLIALLLHKPLWVTIPAYLIIGIVWAVVYLPRSVALQARRYKAWRDELTGCRPLAEYLGPDSKRGTSIHPELFMEQRDQRNGFTERRILTGFIVNIAFWPLRIVEKVLFDFLRSTFIWIGEVLVDGWNKVIVPLLRAIGRWLRALDRWLDMALDWVLTVLKDIWDFFVVSLWRAVRRFVLYIWRDLLVATYTWVYRYVTTIYKTIIHRANREAIADLAALNKTTEDTAK